MPSRYRPSLSRAVYVVAARRPHNFVSISIVLFQYQEMASLSSSIDLRSENVSEGEDTIGGDTISADIYRRIMDSSLGVSADFRQLAIASVPVSDDIQELKHILAMAVDMLKSEQLRLQNLQELMEETIPFLPPIRRSAADKKFKLWKDLKGELLL